MHDLNFLLIKLYFLISSAHKCALFPCGPNVKKKQELFCVLIVIVSIS